MEEINKFLNKPMSSDRMNDVTGDITATSQSMLLFKLNSVYNPNQDHTVSPIQTNMRSQTIPVLDSDEKNSKVNTTVPGNWQRHSLDISKQ